MIVASIQYSRSERRSKSVEVHCALPRNVRWLPGSDCISCLYSADLARPGCVRSPSARSLKSWLAALPDLGVVDTLFAHIDVGFQFFDADGALYAVNRLVINDRCFAGSAINEEAYRQLAARRVLVERHC